MSTSFKKTETKKPRLKALLYAGTGVGKTHFCCSFPDVCYIDTEGLQDYPHFREMIAQNNGEFFYLTELNEIIEKVSSLISKKHTFKTLVIDSLSFPAGWLSQMEAERLQKKSEGKSEGTDYGANLAKGKRLTYKLGILLSMLDMNVIVTSHEKIKYKDGTEIGVTFDISDKMAYSLGAVWNLRKQGKSKRLYIEKSRYPEMKADDSIDFNEGYDAVKNIFGEEIFKREVKVVELATSDQISTFNRTTNLLNISEETIQTWLRTAKAPSLDSLPKDVLQKWIDKLSLQLKGEAA